MNECVDKTSAPWRWERISRERGGIKRRWCGNPLPRVALLPLSRRTTPIVTVTSQKLVTPKMPGSTVPPRWRSLRMGRSSSLTWETSAYGRFSKIARLPVGVKPTRKGLTRALFRPHRRASCLQVHSRQASVPMKSLVPPPRSSTSLTWTALISSPCRSSPETICTTSATGWWVVKASLEYSAH